jgi:hypothetical protein
MTPYRYGMPINSIPPPDPDDPDQKRRTKCYQAIVGCINWLATCTRPDVSPALTFLASYNTKPSAQHYKSALHVLKYLYSTSEYGISFHSDAQNTIQAFNHFPHHHDKKAYSDAIPPLSPASCINLTAFSDACWAGNLVAVPDGTPLELFKYRSLSGYLICCAGGPITCKAIRQDQTANSSCVAEINATHECINDLLSIKHRALNLGIPEAAETIIVYNTDKAAVDWASSITLKGTKHINLHENCVRENHQNGTVRVTHASSTPAISSPKSSRMRPTFVAAVICSWCQDRIILLTGTRQPSLLPHPVYPHTGFVPPISCVFGSKRLPTFLFLCSDKTLVSGFPPDLDCP